MTRRQRRNVVLLFKDFAKGGKGEKDGWQRIQMIFTDSKLFKEMERMHRRAGTQGRRRKESRKDGEESKESKMRKEKKKTVVQG